MTTLRTTVMLFELECASEARRSQADLGLSIQTELHILPKSSAIENSRARGSIFDRLNTC